MQSARILLADDHPLVLQGLQKLLEGEGFNVVATAENGRDLLEVAQRHRPDVIILDISMPLLNGMAAARQLKKLLPQCKLIFLTMHADATYAREAFDAGGSGYLLKRSAASELKEAIMMVLKGRRYLTPLIPHDDFILSETSSGKSLKLGSLTLRQREVLQLLAEGHSVKEIASALNISVKTVEFHKARVMDQLGIHTTAALTKYAMNHGLAAR
ncbi:response regulator transcription factor [Candidatus Nitronereus thalassa]|uniref:Response regulator transcription factor n=1 Tax=Candidatus Nitronereus thalassa TaxID=3020898 RepID=A0ABU3K8U5_9BACT|nr:response regulator transcription factor [Candidatus Nitronereus thalassa]MDT7042789.1 response regulator transcription factor [Candidatus Nitronereus thalassa]